MQRRTFLTTGGVSLCSILGCSGKQSKKGGSDVQVGFGSCVLNKTFKALHPFHDDIEAVAWYIAQDRQKFTLIAIDFGHFSYTRSLEIRKAVSNKTGIPLENVVIHATHNHAAPMWSLINLDLSQINEQISQAVLSAISSSRPAEMAFGSINVGNRFSINRRMNFDGGLGTLTFWYGYNYLEDGSVNARWLFNDRLKRWFGEVPEQFKSTEPLINEGPVDELLQCLSFRDSKTGEIIGNVMRFAAHVQLAMCSRERKYSACVPGYARRRIKDKLGGEAIFINGPCGDLIVKEFLKYGLDPGRFNWASSPLGPNGELACIDNTVWSVVESEGNAMADKWIEALQKITYEPIVNFQTSFSKEFMPMRGDMPHSRGGYEEAKKEAMTAYKRACAAKAPASEIKKCAEVYNRRHWMQNIIEQWYELDDDILKNRNIPYELQSFSLNDVVFIGLPGEVVKDTTDYLRSSASGERVITMTECNADLGYIATREMFPFGSYEVNCGTNHITGEQKLREAALGLIRKVSIS